MLTGDCSCKVTNTLPAVEGQALANHIVGSLRVTGQDACEVKCFLHGLCVSYNLGPQENSGHVCELSDSDHIRNPQDMKTRVDFSYTAFEVSSSFVIICYNTHPVCNAKYQTSTHFLHPIIISLSVQILLFPIKYLHLHFSEWD